MPPPKKEQDNVRHLQPPARQARREPDPTTKALMAQAKAMEEVAAAINRAVDTFEPAMATVHSFGLRLDALCMFLRKKGPWILGSIPGVLVAIQAITPQAAKLLSAWLTGLGAA